MLGKREVLLHNPCRHCERSETIQLFRQNGTLKIEREKKLELIEINNPDWNDLYYEILD